MHERSRPRLLSCSTPKEDDLCGADDSELEEMTLRMRCVLVLLREDAATRREGRLVSLKTTSMRTGKGRTCWEAPPPAFGAKQVELQSAASTPIFPIGRKFRRDQAPRVVLVTLRLRAQIPSTKTSTLSSLKILFGTPLLHRQIGPITERSKLRVQRNLE